MLCCFFFFKQKTAYEMRISDWSSDVCSSDLPKYRQGISRFTSSSFSLVTVASGSTIKRRRYLLSHIRFLSGLALVALAVGMPASASVDSSPKPGGVYRLKPGLYVQKDVACAHAPNAAIRSEEHPSELQSLMRISYAVFCLKTKQNITKTITINIK